MNGPGQRLTALTQALKFPHCERCARLARLMDHNEQLQPGWCMSNLAELVSGVEENAARLGVKPSHSIEMAVKLSIEGGVKYRALLATLRVVAPVVSKTKGCCG